MFRKYGLLGLFLILSVECNFFLKAQPFANWYFPIVWLGYILTIDAVVFKLKKDSLISSRRSQLLGMALLSMLFWWLFEFANISIKNWNYTGISELGTLKSLFGSLSFATVVPALFETVELIRAIHLFDRARLKAEFRISRHLLHSMIIIGAICFIAPILVPRLAFPLVWLSFFFILDPINYLHKQPSIIGHFKQGKLAVPLSVLTAGIILGFLWEFWNYWAITKWTYNVPFIGFFKIFEMPLLGYLGYFPFSFELYSMYWFARSLLIHKDHLLE